MFTIAITFFSGIACGMYATNTPETCQFIAEDSKMTIAVVEDQVQLDKFLKVYTIYLFRKFAYTFTFLCLDLAYAPRTKGYRAVQRRFESAVSLRL